jgi:hypothetical protein
LLRRTVSGKMLIRVFAKPKKLALMFVIGAILLSSIVTNLKAVGSSSIAGQIDLFTQKEPYSGKGQDMPSDAFGPQETVILYALVTLNGLHLQDLSVAFRVQAPNGTSFSRAARTNSGGIATTSFTIPTPSINISENEVFGDWNAFANVSIDIMAFEDSLTFRVDWIIKLISARTIDQNLSNKAFFGRESQVGIEIILRNIAMVMKSATIAVMIRDEADVPVNFSEIDDFEVQSNEKLVYIYCRLSIPEWAYIGKATIFVSALTTGTNESGVPYCPEISCQFYISPIEPLTISFNDVAVMEVTTSSESVKQGRAVNISAVIQNEGTENESFDVSAYYNNAIIETLPIMLTPYSHKILIFALNTAAVLPGNYTIIVSAHLPSDINTSDNTFIGGWILITKLGDLGGGREIPPQFFKFDGLVDGKDVALFLQCYKGAAPQEAMYLADLGGGVPPRFYQCDGVVDDKDVALFLLCYKGLGPPDQ